MNIIEIENLRNEKTKELKVMIQSHEVVEQEKLNIQRQILELQLKKKDLEMALSKSKSNIKQKNIEISLLTSQFWAEKNS